MPWATHRCITMNHGALRQRPSRITIPDSLHSAPAKLVYLYLHQVNTATIDELGADLGLSQLSVLPIIDCLIENEIVRRDGDDLQTIE